MQRDDLARGDLIRVSARYDPSFAGVWLVLDAARWTQSGREYARSSAGGGILCALIAGPDDPIDAGTIRLAVRANDDFEAQCDGFRAVLDRLPEGVRASVFRPRFARARIANIFELDGERNGAYPGRMSA